MKYIKFVIVFLGITSNIQAQEPFFPRFNTELNSWAYLDFEGKEVLQIKLPDIEDLQPFSDGLASAQDAKTHLWGYINILGKWQLRPQFAFASDFKDGFAITYLLCKKNCITVDEGIQSAYNGQIIDQKGNVILKDKAQIENDQERYLFSKNIGHGFFTITYGYGSGNEMGVIDRKGKVICSSGDVSGPNGFIIYDEELGAIRCANVYYKSTGEKVLDLSKYSYIKPFENGSTWGLYEEENGYDELTFFHILIDKTGKEIFRIDYEVAAETQAYLNGKFKYIGNDGELYEYDMASSNSILIPNGKVENSLIIIGPMQRNGYQLIYASDYTNKVIGFRNKNGQEFYK